ncbi:membrane protein CrgA [Streptomyces sp. NBRC 110611]|uniref:transglycosylase SLT domain-containing protein n=1 Tax=Streptomyces sp. NBRC 110611 TaxID=1621259 RepID=UPI00082C1B3C|nr:transglycosylase SLT domain-containing protein [Streptomyces sp. NBRC 110611]GAU68492.1 membrane protein CrgA [Streptomyces sp. NBRC 110611]
MSKPALPGLHRLTRTHKITAAGVVAAGAAALVFSTLPGADTETAGPQAVAAEHVKPVAFAAVDTAARTQQATIAKQADRSAAKGKAEAAAKKREAQQAASRSAVRTAIPAAAKPAAKTYPDNLDGWIRESLDVMAQKGIPGSYNGIYRNIIRESSGNPMAINLWDINAQNGIPSKGLLQVIDPTFKAYHVEGTSWNVYDPVANITAACNYAAARYGSMDNVNSAY